MAVETKTVVVTGASSGIGKATVQLFAEKGWNVVAAMRQPLAEPELVETERLKLVSLDVQDPASVKAAVPQVSPLSAGLTFGSTMPVMESSVH